MAEMLRLIANSIMDVHCTWYIHWISVSSLSIFVLHSTTVHKKNCTIGSSSEMTTIHHFNFVEEEVMKLSDPLSITLREFDDGDEITKRDTNCTR